MKKTPRGTSAGAEPMDSLGTYPKTGLARQILGTSQGSRIGSQSITTAGRRNGSRRDRREPRDGDHLSSGRERSPLLHDAMARPLEGLLQLGRNGIGNILQHVLVERIAAEGRHAEGLGPAVRRVGCGERNRFPIVWRWAATGAGEASRLASGNSSFAVFITVVSGECDELPDQYADDNQGKQETGSYGQCRRQN